MKAQLKIQSGPEKGRSVWVAPGMRMGRRQAEILVQDPKISSYHAEITSENGALWVEDRQSTHGLWSPTNRVQRVSLKEGALFKMGDSLFKVVTLEVGLPDLAVPELLSALKGAVTSTRERPGWVYRPFPHLLHLEFLQGPHEGEVWPIGYGPRSFGSESLDGILFDPEGRPECFQLHYQEDKVVLKSVHEHFVQINGRYVQDSIVATGDLIAFGETHIKIWW